MAEHLSVALSKVHPLVMYSCHLLLKLSFVVDFDLGKVTRSLEGKPVEGPIEIYFGREGAS